MLVSRSPTIRDAVCADLGEILRLYAPYVLETAASFEEVPPSLEEMTRRQAAIVAAGLPYLVAVEAGSEGGEILGYAYATAYRSRSAYRFAVEDSVYVAPGRQRRGIGGALLATLVARCRAGGWRQMIAVVGDSANAGSVALHRKAGFVEVGTLRDVGFKHGRWVDTVLMQRDLQSP